MREGERVGITDRGVLVAVIVPPGAAGGAAALVAAGRTRPATRDLPDTVAPAGLSGVKSGDVLDDLRDDRV